MSEWQRVTNQRRCPICEKPDWCLYAGPAYDPTAAICARVESEKRCGEAGWLHRLRDDSTWRPRRRTIRFGSSSQTTATGIDFDQIAAQCVDATNLSALRRLAENLGLSENSLIRLGVGWSRKHCAWTFPMRDTSRTVVGIRLRFLSGNKLSIKGGKEGLFIPSGLADTETLLVCEGATDAAAVVEIGFTAIGRPSCRGGRQLILEYVKQHKPAQVAIVADGDTVGQCGAESLAASLLAYVAVRIITPPDGINDARQWKQQGATQDDVQAVIEAAPPKQLKITSQAK